MTYQLESNKPGVVTHRVVGVGNTSDGERPFLTRGDANNVDDDPVRAVQVRGVVVYTVPYLGYVNTWVGINRPGWLLKAVAGVLILYGLVLVGAGVRDRFRRGREIDPVVERTEPDVAPAPTPVPADAAAEPSDPAAVDDRPVTRPRAVPIALVLGVAVCVVVVGALVAGGRRSR